MKALRIVWLILLAGILAACNTSLNPTEPETITPQAIVLESFENTGLPITAGIVNLPTGFTFGSGVTFTAPTNNNTAYGSFGAHIIICGVVPNGFFGFLCATDAGFIPDGSAYLGLANPGFFFPGIELTFPTDVLNASMAIADAAVTVSAYDASGTLVDSANAPLVGFAAGWGANVVQVASAGGIRKIIINGSGAGVLRLDALQFETVPNQPPSVATNNASVGVNEGQTANNSGTVSDPNGDTVALTASVGTIVNNNDGTWSWSFGTSDGPAESQTVTIDADDGNGGTAQTTFGLVVNNVPPTPNAGPDQTVYRNDTVNVSGTWTDPAGSADNPYDWTWDLSGDSTPDTSGTASFSSTFTESTSFALEGFYTLSFGVTDKDGGSGSDDVVIEVLNRPPDCSAVQPSIATLWPPNHQFVMIDVVGVTDPEGDATTITIDSIYQDEAVDASGSGNTGPDGQGVGSSSASVRAERMNNGNGRVYHISFTADDGHGGTCSSEVLVGVPKSQGKKGAAVDDGALFDSTVVP